MERTVSTGSIAAVRAYLSNIGAPVTPEQGHDVVALANALSIRTDKPIAKACVAAVRTYVAEVSKAISNVQGYEVVALANNYPHRHTMAGVIDKVSKEARTPIVLENNDPMPALTKQEIESRAKALFDKVLFENGDPDMLELQKLKDDIEDQLNQYEALRLLRRMDGRDECGYLDDCAFIEISYTLYWSKEYGTELVFVVRDGQFVCYVRTWHFIKGSQTQYELAGNGLDDDVTGDSINEIIVASLVKMREHIAVLERLASEEALDRINKALELGTKRSAAL